MKHKTTALLLVICLLLACFLPVTTVDAAGGLCFIACNDTLLTLDSMPYFGAQTYVPSWVFSNFGIYFSYFDSSRTGMAFTSSNQVYFSADSDVASDNEENLYYAPMIPRGGSAYLPLDFMCSYFGLSWSYVTGNGYGDIIRIKNSSVILTDSQFLSAASSLMEQRYNAYYGISEATPSPSQSSPQPSQVQHEDITIYLSFIGIPDEDVLSELESYSMNACFFLSEKDISDSPDTVRRIYGMGHNVGLLCNAPDDVNAAAELLFEASHQYTFLVTGEGMEDSAEKHGLVYCGYTISDVGEDGEHLSVSEITSAISKAESGAVLRMECCDELSGSLPDILNFLKTARYTIDIIDETFLNGDASSND